MSLPPAAAAGVTAPAPPGPARWRKAAVLLATLLTAALTARLGWWQLDRAAQKQALQARIEARGRMPPLPAEALARGADEAQAQFQRVVLLHGRWLTSATVWLDNRSLNGRAGFIVVTPLLLPGGEAVVVQRGWVPRDAGDRQRLPPLPDAPGERSLRARVAPPPSALLSLGDAAPETGRIRQNLDMTAYARQVGVRLRPLSLQQLQDDTAAPDPGQGSPLPTVAAKASAVAGAVAAASAPPVSTPGALLRDWPQPAVDVGKHHRYAVQWFALCALTLGLYLWFQILQPRRHARHRR